MLDRDSVRRVPSANCAFLFSSTFTSPSFNCVRLIDVYKMFYYIGSERFYCMNSMMLLSLRDGACVRIKIMQDRDSVRRVPFANNCAFPVSSNFTSPSFNCVRLMDVYKMFYYIGSEMFYCINSMVLLSFRDGAYIIYKNVVMIIIHNDVMITRAGNGLD